MWGFPLQICKINKKLFQIIRNSQYVPQPLYDVMSLNPVKTFANTDIHVTELQIYHLGANGLSSSSFSFLKRLKYK